MEKITKKIDEKTKQLILFFDLKNKTVSRKKTLFALLLIGAALLPYAPMVTYSGFVMDDAVAVQRNPNVVSESVSFSEFMKRDFWGLELFAGTWTHKSFRPVTTLTYRLGFLLHGTESSGFHIATYLMHAICSGLVFFFASQVVGLSFLSAAASAALFAAHPVHTENVLYLVGRADVLSSIFFMPAIMLAESNLNTNNLINVGIFTLLSGLSKETGFTAPLIAACITLVREKRLFSAKFSLLFFLALCLFYWRHRYTNGTEVNMSVQDNPFSYETDFRHRVLSFGMVHAKYLELLLLPMHLCYDYSLTAMPVLRSVFDVRFLSVCAAYLAMSVLVKTIVSLYLSKHLLGTQLMIGFILSVIPWLPASNILFPVGTVVGERLLYTPSIGFVVMLGALMDFFIRSKKRLIQISFLLLALYMTRTAVRVTDWADGDTLFLRDGHRQQASSKTQFNLGITHMSNKNYDKAVAALIRCAAADPMSALPYWRIGQIEILRGNFTTAEAWLMEASTKFSATLMIKDEEIFHDIAVAVFQNKKIDRAHFYLSLALEINPRFPKGLNNYGCLLASKDPKKSTEFIKKAVEMKPDHKLYLSNLLFMSEYSGDGVTHNWVRSLSPEIAHDYRKDCVWEFVPAS
jgi:Flp pilus assembly protein TadD